MTVNGTKERPFVIEGGDGADGRDGSDAWPTARREILRILVATMKCDVAILRAEAADASNLILEDYVPLAVDQSDGIVVPQTKLLRFWNGDAFTTSSRQNYPNGSLAVLSDDEKKEYSDSESRFLSRVHWRGTFPLAIGAKSQRLTILVSFQKDAPAWLEHGQMGIAWLVSEVIAASVRPKAPPGSPTHSLANAAAHIGLMPLMRSREDKLAALLRIVCSGKGLGWHRAWIMKVAGDELRCETCAGGESLDEWGRGASFANTDLPSLADEIAHDIVDKPRNSDGLFRMCVLNATLKVPSNIVEPSVPRPRGDVLFRTLVELDFNQSGQWKNAIESLQSEKAFRFGDAERLYSCPFSLADDKYVLFVSDWSEAPAVGEISDRSIDCGALLAAVHAITATATTQSPESRFDSSLLNQLLSWIGVSVCKHSEFETLRSMRYRIRFESSEEYRMQIGKRMLDEWLKRTTVATDTDGKSS